MSVCARALQLGIAYDNNHRRYWEINSVIKFIKKILWFMCLPFLIIIFLTLEFLNKKFSKVGAEKFWDDHGPFPWVAEMEAATKDIQEELAGVLSGGDIPGFQELSKEQESLTEGKEWTVFMLYVVWNKVQKNCDLCPKTAAALEKIPGMTSALFSIFAPNKRLAPHRGPYNGVLRYHLALKIPSEGEKCGITVGGETRYWAEGGSLIFDDAWQHEAWNDTDETRVVLFVDFLRPLPWPLNKINKFVFWSFNKSPLVKNLLDKL